MLKDIVVHVLHSSSIRPGVAGNVKTFVSVAGGMDGNASGGRLRGGRRCSASGRSCTSGAGTSGSRVVSRVVLLDDVRSSLRLYGDE